MHTCHSRPSANTLFTTNLLCPKHTIITWSHPPKLVWVIKCLGKTNKKTQTYTHTHPKTHRHIKNTALKLDELCTGICAGPLKKPKKQKTLPNNLASACIHHHSQTTKSNASKWGTKCMSVCPCFKTNPTQKSHHHKATASLLSGRNA